MKRFYEPNLMTCFKSGSFLFLVALAIIVTAFWSQTVFLTGMITIILLALVFGRTLAAAGLDAMLVRLSPFSKRKALFLLGVSILFAFFAFVIIVPLMISLFGTLSIQFVRLSALAAATCYLPFFTVARILTIEGTD